MTVSEKKINELFEELVPVTGKADTVAGEIIRAVSRIGYRNYNDGDMIGIGYGKETCNPAARYLMNFNDEYINNVIGDMWGNYNEAEYDELLQELGNSVLDYIAEHPELKTTKNKTDMWDFRTDEDEDDYEEDDEDWY